jgi:hypothetical protein
MAALPRWIRASAIGLVVLAVAGIATSCNPPTAARWEQLPDTGLPSARPGARMAFDQASSQLVLFGGLSQAPLADTWTMQGDTWQQENPFGSPSGRYDDVMVYDPAHGNIMLFGGFGFTGAFGGGTADLGDTWLWNGTNWIQQSPDTSPSPREGAVAAYSPATKSVILFGGKDDGVIMDDTWSWDGSNWTQLDEPTAPTQRTGAAMTFDEARQNVVLYGGFDGANSLSDTWRFDASGWTNTNAAPGPGPVISGQLAYQGDVREDILFGGGPSATTWAWTGTTWQPRAVDQPSARDDSAMAFDSHQNRLVLFGGSNAHDLDDTWVYWVPPSTITNVAYHCTGQTTDNIITGGAPGTQSFAFDANFNFERTTYPTTAPAGSAVTFSVGRMYSPNRFDVQPLNANLDTVDVGSGIFALEDTWKHTTWQSDFGAVGGNPPSVPIAPQPTFEDIPAGRRPVWTVPATPVNPSGSTIEWQLPLQLHWTGSGSYIEVEGGTSVEIVQSWDGTCSRPAPAQVIGTTQFS